MKTLICTLTLGLLMLIPSSAQHSLKGIWEGAITVPGGQLKIIFKIEESANGYSGTLDIPQQGAKSLRLDPITQKGDSVLLIFTAGHIKGTFSGAFESETKITGNYLQGEGKTTFAIERTAAQTHSQVKPNNEQDYIIPNGDLVIGGTLTLPKAPVKGPLLIMISGSGVQDRDSNIFDFKIFAVLAQHLAAQGIPSFRYDDRGIGKSSGNFANATLDDLTSDVNTIISFFQNNAENRFTEFAVLGHSQGGIVAGKLAVENKAIVQLILMGSTAPGLNEILRYQAELAFLNTPVEKSLVDKELDAREALMKAVVADEGIEEAKENYKTAYINLLNNLPEIQRNSIPDISQAAENQAAQLTSIYGTPQMKSLLFYVPTNDLEKVDVPTLVLFGKKDTQVTLTQNQAGIREALEKSGTEYQIKVFEAANHLFQKANTGMVTEYPTLKKEFVDGFPDTLSNWILSHYK